MFFSTKNDDFSKKALDMLVWSSFSLAFAQNFKMDKPKEKKHKWKD